MLIAPTDDPGGSFTLIVIDENGRRRLQSVDFGERFFTNLFATVTGACNGCPADSPIFGNDVSNRLLMRRDLQNSLAIFFEILSVEKNCDAELRGPTKEEVLEIFNRNLAQVLPGIVVFDILEVNGEIGRILAEELRDGQIVIFNPVDGSVTVLDAPSSLPSLMPTIEPSAAPAVQESALPTPFPSSQMPSLQPTSEESNEPTAAVNAATQSPTEETDMPSEFPSEFPVSTALLQ